MMAMLATTIATSLDMVTSDAADKPRTDVPGPAYNFETARKLSP